MIELASADHLAGANSLIEGMGSGKRGYYIHTSGTGMLCDISPGYGIPSEKIYNDIADVKEITSFDLTHVHRDVDEAVIAAGVKYGVPTAIVSPCTIHGVGKGPIKQRSLQIPWLIETTIKRGKSFMVKAGQNYWNRELIRQQVHFKDWLTWIPEIHIDDLAAAYELLVQEALKQEKGSATWGSDGYYFTEAGEFQWGQISTALAQILYDRSTIATNEVDHLTPEEVSEIHPYGPRVWGSNSRSRSDRFRSLGWQAVGPTIFDTLPEMVDFEINTD
jgi:hypothetical protein